ncbi:hypothetical protein BY996DRAFT_6419534 [Phakopsora pachyrhizi]|nr:hypothetical protein BY996DRAFT_6419534 [Phakopsora pachyrhizi]
MRDDELDLKEIYEQRARSLMKLNRTIDSICHKYPRLEEDEDDVMDLMSLRVIEDRGMIIRRFERKAGGGGGGGGGSSYIFNQQVPVEEQEDHQGLSKKLLKGKQRATNQIGLDDCYCKDQNEVEDDEDEDDWSDERGSDSEDSSSVIYLGDSIKLHRTTTHPSTSTSSKLTSSSSPTLTPSSPSTNLTQPIRGYKCLGKSCSTDPRSVTNALFERLKRRVEERSLEIFQLRANHHTKSHNLLSFEASSTPNSVNTTLEFDDTVTLDGPIDDPNYLSRTRKDGSHTINHSTSASSDPRPKRIVTVTIPRNSALLISKPSNRSTKKITSKNKQKPTLLPSSFSSSPYSSSNFLSESDYNNNTPTTTTSAGRKSRSDLRDDCFDFKPSLLFKSLDPSKTTSSSSVTTPFRERIQNMNLMETDQQDQLEGVGEEEMMDEFCRESSEDPIYLPQSSSTKKRRIKRNVSGRISRRFIECSDTDDMTQGLTINNKDSTINGDCGGEDEDEMMLLTSQSWNSRRLGSWKLSKTDLSSSPCRAILRDQTKSEPEGEDRIDGFEKAERKRKRD